MPKGLTIKFLLLVIIGAGLGAIAQLILFPEKVPTAPLQQSSWSLLNDDERKILQPLANKWEGMDSLQQKKWRAIAKKYPSLSLSEQHKLQRRMVRWADAQPEQRAVARKKYKNYKKKKPEEQKRLRSKWENHQKSKAKDSTASDHTANENPPRDGVVTKETESPPAIEQPGSGPITEDLRSESQ